MDGSVARVFVVVVLAATSGCQSNLRSSQSDATPLTVVASEVSPSSDRIAVAGPGPRDYSTELAMGARCPDGDSLVSLMTWPIRGACTGPGPAHLMEVMRALEPSIRWSDEALRAFRGSRQAYVAVPGLGTRPDFFMVLDSVWIRSFEGPDEEGVVYLVQAPFRLYETPGENSPWPEVALSPDCGVSGLMLRAFRMDQNGSVTDVTEKLMPPRPVLTELESHRYGPHIARIDKACDSEIGLLTSNLQYVPTMRWAITDFDPETPLPPTDGRHQGADGWAHFGFIVWNGKTFNLVETVPEASWPCLAGQACEERSDQIDHYVIEASN